MTTKKHIKKIGILTSGGDAPGMNAAIRAAVRSANYYDIEACGILYGYKGLIEDEIIHLSSKSVANILQQGGTILKTARCKEFMERSGREKAFDIIKKNDIDALVIIGGDGSLTGAHIFYEEFGIPCVGMPGTIDNDLAGTDYTIGFDTATNTAIEAIDKIRDTADALDRIFIIEVMGKDCGYIAMYSGLSTGAGSILLPEKPLSKEEIQHSLREIKKKRKKSVHLIVMAEGFNISAVEILNLVQVELPQYDSRLCVLGHIQRGGSPTYFDRLLASRMSFGAIQCIRDRHFGVMVGVVNNKLAYTPLSQIVKKKYAIGADYFEMIHVLSS